MKFTVNTPGPIDLRQDSVVDYTIRWAGLPIRWRTLMTQWQPMTAFEDMQIRGPYAVWLHQHTFAEVADGVQCSDRVIYKLPGGPIGRLMNRLTVQRQLAGIFRYRREVISRELGWQQAILEDVTFKALG